jgi:hypothetical protein
LHFAVLVCAEGQYSRVARNGVDPEQLILIVHYEFALGVCR